MTERNADVSKTLTDKWKKGELPEGLYYFKLPNGEIMPGTDYCLATYLLTKDSNRCEVLGEVPSYEQWKAKLEENTKLKEILKKTKANGHYPDRISRLKSRVVALSEENTKLKELLKECRDEIEFMYDTYGQSFPKPFDDSLLTKINQVLGEE